MTPAMVGSIWLAVKVILIIAMVIYAIFAAIIVRQEQLMANVLEEASESILRVLSFVHLAASVAIVFLAIILL
jgi:uncharacterized membrane protein